MANIIPIEITQYLKVLESKETYEFIGLTEKVASEVWERYSTSDPDMPDTFL